MGIFAKAGQAIANVFNSFGALGAAPPTRNTKPNGGDGVQAYGGFLPTDEGNPHLTGTQKWITYSNATNTAVVATGLRRTLDMLAGTDWHAEPNPDGGKNAKRAADLVTKGLLNAQLPKPWSTVVRKTALYRYYGFSLHEWSVKTDSKGDVVFADIAHRPQHTVDRWDKPSEQMPWQAVSQLTRAGNRFIIPRSRLFHAVDDSLTDSPDGVGLMRHIIELVRRLGILEGLEGLAFETDVRGMPIGRAPIGKLKDLAGAEPGLTQGQVEAFIRDRTQNLRNALVGIAKTPERLQYLMLPSDPYTNPDGTLSSMQQWGLELLKGDGHGLAELHSAIGRIQLEIARVLGIEFAMMGGGSSGSKAMHGDKTDFFATNLQTMLTEIAAFATNDLARTLVGLNGMDPETCTPTLVAEPVSLDAIQNVCTALAALAQAGAVLDPRDPAIPVIRDRMHLPEPLVPSPQEMGLLQLGAKPQPPGVPGKPIGTLGPSGPSAKPAPGKTKPGTKPDPASTDAAPEDLGPQKGGKAPVGKSGHDEP